MPIQVQTGAVRTHIKFFLFYNLLYFLPLAWVAVYEFSQNGISEAAAVNWQDLRRVTLLYVLGCGAFCLGSGFRYLTNPLRRDAGGEWIATKLPLHST